MLDGRISTPEIPLVSVSEQSRNLLNKVLNTWWESDTQFPSFAAAYPSYQQAHYEKQLSHLINGLIHELKHLPQSGAAQEELQERLQDNAIAFIQDAFGFEDHLIHFLKSSGLLQAAQTFARMARQFDPSISGEDIYQASRNVMSMNFIQLLMNRPVEVTPAVFAYSMLYPYTNNYLDDPGISPDTKRAFNLRFQRRLEGEKIHSTNAQEELISSLVDMIEGQFPRQQYPQVWESLLVIHVAQARSLKLVAPRAAPYEVDVLGISFEKGGASVLADGYLVAGTMTDEEMAFTYGYGAFTQLMDDLEDVRQDQKEGRMTIFSQCGQRWMLDAITNRMIHFGRSVLDQIRVLDSPNTEPLRELIARGLDPILINTIGRAAPLYSRAYLRALESHMPLRFSALRKERRKLDRHKVSLSSLVNLWI